MVITEKINMLCTPINKKWYELKGYTWENNKYIMIKIEDISPNSIYPIKIKCDICGKEIIRKYQEYRVRKEKDIIGIDCCDECKYIKLKIIKNYKQKNKILKRSESGYWSYKENRINELKYIINKYGKFNNSKDTNNEWKYVMDNIARYEDVYDLIEQIGYNAKDIRGRNKDNYYEDFEILKRDILKVIKEYKCFPPYSLLCKELKIGNIEFKRFGGIFEIKRKMGYTDKNYYISDDGFYNRSAYEYIVIQWLLNNTDGKFKREQMPFKKYDNKLGYKSDIMFIYNNQEYHVEIWGLIGSGNDVYGYNETHDIKKSLYEQYNINLISIYPEIFYQSYENIQKFLYDLFKPYFNIKSKKINNIIISPIQELNDEELYNEIMKTYNPNTMTGEDFKKSNLKLYKEAEKRANGFCNFLSDFNVLNQYNSNGYWTEEKIILRFVYMIETYGKILSRTEITKYKTTDKEIWNISKIFSCMRKYGGMINNRLKTYEYCLQNNIILPSSETEFLNNVIENKGTQIKNKVTLKQQEKAKQLYGNFAKAFNVSTHLKNNQHI